jgi:hypothetical protein
LDEFDVFVISSFGWYEAENAILRIPFKTRAHWPSF